MSEKLEEPCIRGKPDSEICQFFEAGGVELERDEEDEDVEGSSQHFLLWGDVLLAHKAEVNIGEQTLEELDVKESEVGQVESLLVH